MSGNPPDKPGYKLLRLMGNPNTDNTALDILADQGYKLTEYQPEALNASNYLLFDNYKKES